MQVPILDLKAQYLSLKEEIDNAIRTVFDSQQFINGPQVGECEKAIAAYSQALFATGVSSGTDALLIPLMIEKIGPGDEVIVPNYSFFATAGVVARVGAKPVFVDIDPVTFNIDPQKIEESITAKTKAIIPVHLFGQMADMMAIGELADKYHLIVIEDAAQAIGAECNRKRAGSFGHYGTLSFFPSKNLGCAGDGGMIITSDPKRDELSKIFRQHGSKVKYRHTHIGGNFRLDTLQAAILLAKLPLLDRWTAARQEHAKYYRELFERTGLLGTDLIALPEETCDRHIFNQYVGRFTRRDRLIAWLRDHGIECVVYYPIPFHQMECFADLGYSIGDFPESEKASGEALAIPIYPEMTSEMQEYVVDTIAEFYRK